MDAPLPTPTERWRGGPRAWVLTMSGVVRLRIWLSDCVVYRSGLLSQALCNDASRLRRSWPVHWSTSRCVPMSASVNVVTAPGRAGRSRSWPRSLCGALCRTSRARHGSPTARCSWGSQLPRCRRAVSRPCATSTSRSTPNTDHGLCGRWSPMATSSSQSWPMRPAHILTTSRGSSSARRRCRSWPTPTGAPTWSGSTTAGPICQLWCRLRATRQLVAALVAPTKVVGMPVLEFDPPDRFVAGTVGPPGQRTFFLQASAGSRLASVSLEKQQLSTLADRVNDLLDDFAAGEAAEMVAEVLEDLDPLATPIEDEFRVGTMSLGWDAERRVVIVECHDGQAELLVDDQGEPTLEPERPGDFETVLRVVIEPAPARAFARRCSKVVAAGRPPCPFCGGPLDPTGHICPRANGYKR